MSYRKLKCTCNTHKMKFVFFFVLIYNLTHLARLLYMYICDVYDKVVYSDGHVCVYGVSGLAHGVSAVLRLRLKNKYRLASYIHYTMT